MSNLVLVILILFSLSRCSDKVEPVNTFPPARELSGAENLLAMAATLRPEARQELEKGQNSCFKFQKFGTPLNHILADGAKEICFPYVGFEPDPYELKE